MAGRYSTKEVVKLMEEIGFPPSTAATFQVPAWLSHTKPGANPSWSHLPPRMRQPPYGKALA